MANLNVRLTEAQKSALESQARALGVSLSDFAREKLGLTPDDAERHDEPEGASR